MKLSPGIDRAVLETLTYADIFDQPLTAAEIRRYLHGRRISAAELDDVLASGTLPIARAGDWFMLPGREALAQVRETREAHALAWWDRAIACGRRIAGLPFVRMVGLTGALAVRNAAAGADLDYLVVAAQGRAWTCRLFVIGLVRWEARRGLELCPNYFLTENALALADRSVFTAHELAQMVPIAGLGVYAAMRAANPWVDELLPNAADAPHPEIVPVAARPYQRIVEYPLKGRLGSRLESWEMQRKITKFRGEHSFTDETQFNADRVQGHFNSYRARTLAEFNRRLLALSDQP